MDYPLWNVFLTTLWFFVWVMWFFLLFRIIIDIFRSQDLTGWGKAGWLIVILILPFIGVLIYLIARGHSMGDRDAQQARAADDAFRSYVQEAAAPTGHTAADEITKLADLRDKGVLTEDEFAQRKAKILA